MPGGSKAETRVLAYMDDLNIQCNDKWLVESVTIHTGIQSSIRGQAQCEQEYLPSTGQIWGPVSLGGLHPLGRCG